MAGLWPILTRTLRARRLRALLSALAVAAGVAAVLGTQVTVGALDSQAAEAVLERAGSADLDVRAIAATGFDNAQVSTLASLPGVALAEPLLQKRVAVTAGGPSAGSLEVILTGISEEGTAALRAVPLVEGALPRPSQGSHHEVALDAGVVGALSARAGQNLHAGDTIRLTTATGPDSFVLSGITRATATAGGAVGASAFVTDADARGPFGLGLHTSLVALHLRPGADPASVATAVVAALGQAATVSDPRAGTDAPIRQLRPLIALAVTLSVVIGAAVTANSVAVGAVERRREIGLLRAAGASRRQVLGLLISEALLVGVAGCVIGLGAGIGLGALLTRAFSAPGVPVPATVTGLAAVAGALGAGLAAVVGGALLPALAATRVSALDALRSSPTGPRERVPMRLRGAAVLLGAAAVALLSVGRAETASAGAACALLAIAAAMPLAAPALLGGLGRVLAPLIPRAPVAAAGLVRRGQRTGLVAGVITLSVASAVSLAALTGGALDAGDRWVGGLFAGDAVLVSPATAQDALVAEIGGQTGLVGGRLRFVTARVGGTVSGLTAVDVGPFLDHGGLDVVEGNRADALRLLATPGADAILVPRVLAEARGWHAGDHVTLDGGTVPAGGTPAGSERVPFTVTVAGVVAHGFPSRDGAEGVVAGRDAAVRWLGGVATGFDDLQVIGGAAHEGDLRAVAARYGMQAATVPQMAAGAHDALARTLGLLGAVGWLGVAVAMAAVVNTLVVNVRQSTRELAVLRAAGLSRRGALRLVLLEAALLATVGVVAGVVAGCAIAIPLLRASGSPGFDPGFAPPLGAIAAAAVAVIAGAVLAALFPGRRAARASIVAAIRHE